MPSTSSPRIRIAVGKAPPSGTSQLDQLIASLAASVGTAGSNVGVLAYTWAGDTGAFLDWQVRWHWHASGVAYLFCKAAESAGSPPYKLFIYDEATNQFTNPYDVRGGINGGSITGHGYDQSTLDPATGDFYIMPYLAKAASKWDGSSNWNIATGTWTSDISNPRALVWHPNLYGPANGGLATMFSSQIRTWRKSGGTGFQWQALGNIGSSPIYTQGCYAPAFDQVLMTAGTTSRSTWWVSGGTTPTYTQGPDTPVVVSSDAFDTRVLNRMLPTPAGTLAIFESRQSGNQVWRMRTDGSRLWELQPWTHSMGDAGVDSHPMMFMQSKGAYAALAEQNNGGSPPKFQVWLPPVGF